MISTGKGLVFLVMRLLVEVFLPVDAPTTFFNLDGKKWSRLLLRAFGRR